LPKLLIPLPKSGAVVIMSWTGDIQFCTCNKKWHTVYCRLGPQHTSSRK